MSRLASWMMRLYPARWRARYGDELDALLADTGADARIVGDLFRGGVRMQMKTWPFLKLAFALGLVGLLLGTGVAWLLPSEYESRATLQMEPMHIDESQAGDVLTNPLFENIQQLQIVVMSRTELARIIRNLDLYREELATRPLEDVIEEMRHNIHFDLVTLPGKLRTHAAAFNIVFLYPDRYKAQQTVSALVAAFMIQNQEQSKPHIPRTETTLIIEDAASLPQKPLSPKTPMLLLVAFLTGVAVAGLWRLAHPVGVIRRRFALTTLAMGLSALTLMVAAISLPLWPHWYRSTGSLKLSNGSHEQVEALTKDVLSRTSLSVIINDPRLLLYADQLGTTPLEDVIQSMKQHISINETTVSGGRYIGVSFEYYDPYKANQVVSALMNRFAKVGMELQTNPVPSLRIATVLDVLDNASLPVSPAKPNRYLIAGTGSVAGIILAVIISLIRRRWKPESDFPVSAVPE